MSPKENNSYYTLRWAPVDSPIVNLIFSELSCYNRRLSNIGLFLIFFFFLRKMREQSTLYINQNGSWFLSRCESCYKILFNPLEHYYYYYYYRLHSFLFSSFSINIMLSVRQITVWIVKYYLPSAFKVSCDIFSSLNNFMSSRVYW